MDKRIDERTIICIICPNSCRLSVWRDVEGEIHIKGNQCTRGITYGNDEYTNPKRMLITTMQIENGIIPLIPIRSSSPIPKQFIFKAMRFVNEQSCDAPVKMGQILVKNILETGVDIIASRSIRKSPQFTISNTHLS
jgi:CxxC motif-containing protein